MSKKNLMIAALAALCALSCRPSAEDYLAFMYEAMPLPDSLVFPESSWRANAEKTLEVRKRMDWNVPVREFRHFVLPLRVNNENLDDFRTVYADSLCARVEGMTIGEAALEINHWCHERATYVPSDGRTLGPMALIRSGLGRCGEESVLAVAALRAAGIPARQVYTPRWAHTDDNHAWVEVYVDGKWHFMGACEPEPVLDLAWFNSSVSRAMLLHTKVFGAYNGPEDVISRTSSYTEINCIKSYIPTRRTGVTVRDTDGNPVEGAAVEFRIYNYAEFYKVASYRSDSDGHAALDTGLGDIVIWAYKDGLFGLAVAGAEESEVVLDRKLGEPCSIDLEIVPPVEDPLPNNATGEEIEANARRLAAENVKRASMPHPRTYAPDLFLSDKDAVDVTGEFIEDARAVTGTDRWTVCPRVELEMLLPYRREILSSGIAETVKSPSEVVRWVSDSIKVDTGRNPQGLRIPPVAVWRSRIADPRSRDIFFVALCRTLGFAARLDEATSRPEYREGDDWVGVDFGAGTEAVVPKGHVDLFYPTASSAALPEYYRHYTFSRITDGSPRLCEFDESVPPTFSYDLDEGYYMLVSGTRLASGAVLAHVEMFNLEASGEGKEVRLILPEPGDRVRVIGNLDAERLFLREGDSEPAAATSCSA
ncbi:MAG: transglutaminase domain-containing protein [Bacteroidales bacterium]|nr:transglutaminase domain-containing protein [Bacteroidales bacterium]